MGWGEAFWIRLRKLGGGGRVMWMDNGFGFFWGGGGLWRWKEWFSWGEGVWEGKVR